MPPIPAPITIAYTPPTSSQLDSKYFQKIVLDLAHLDRRDIVDGMVFKLEAPWFECTMRRL